MASAPRPWYTGPAVVGAALFVILNAPASSGEAVRAMIGRGWEFTTTVLGDTPDDPGTTEVSGP